MHAVRTVSPSIATEYAAHLFFKPQRTKPHPREAEVLARATEMVVTARRGHELRGWSWGQRDLPIVLVVHGWSGRASQLASFVDPLLDRGFRVVAFDLSAHGRSGARSTNIVQLAEDLLAIGDYVGPAEAIVTHSFGGPVATLSMVAGLRVQRAVFVSPPFDASTWLNTFTGFFSFDDALSERFRRRLEAAVGLRFEELSGESLAPGMRKPLLVIHDEEDADVPLRHGEQLAAHWPGATLITTSGLGHHQILRDEQVVAHTARFIAQQDGETS